MGVHELQPTDQVRFGCQRVRLAAVASGMREDKVVHQIPWVHGVGEKVIDIRLLDCPAAVMALSVDLAQPRADRR